MSATALVELTPAAADKVIELRGDDPAKSFLRVYVAGQGCGGVQYGMAFVENVESDDQLVQSRGVALAIDPAAQASVSGVEIDFIETPQGAGFTVNNPSQTATSGCGSGCGCGHGH